VKGTDPEKREYGRGAGGGDETFHQGGEEKEEEERNGKLGGRLAIGDKKGRLGNVVLQRRVSCRSGLVRGVSN